MIIITEITRVDDETGVGTPNQLHLAANIRKVVKIPVIAVCNVKHPAFAEQMLEEGAVDFVGIARGHLADPEWGKKASAGNDILIRKCLGCMECFRILNDGLPLGCTLNPVLGREFEYGAEKLVRDGAGRTAAVIGGGPAGMEAALRKAYVDKLICVLTFKAAC